MLIKICVLLGEDLIQREDDKPVRYYFLVLDYSFSLKYVINLFRKVSSIDWKSFQPKPNQYWISIVKWVSAKISKEQNPRKFGLMWKPTSKL